MKEQNIELTEDDFREALSMLGTFVDVPKSDLKKKKGKAVTKSKCV